RPEPFKETEGASETVNKAIAEDLKRRSTDQSRRSTDTGYVRPEPFENERNLETIKNDPALQEFYRREGDVKPETKAEEIPKEPEVPKETVKESGTKDNKTLADTFRKNADLLESEGGDPFRLRAYRNAAEAIENHPQSIADLIKE